MVSLPIYRPHAVRPKPSNSHTPSALSSPLSCLIVGSLGKELQEPNCLPGECALSLWKLRTQKIKVAKEHNGVACLVFLKYIFIAGICGCLSTLSLICKMWVGRHIDPGRRMSDISSASQGCLSWMLITTSQNKSKGLEPPGNRIASNFHFSR